MPHCIILLQPGFYVQNQKLIEILYKYATYPGTKVQYKDGFRLGEGRVTEDPRMLITNLPTFVYAKQENIEQRN